MNLLRENWEVGVSSSCLGLRSNAVEWKISYFLDLDFFQSGFSEGLSLWNWTHFSENYLEMVLIEKNQRDPWRKSILVGKGGVNMIFRDFRPFVSALPKLARNIWQFFLLLRLEYMSYDIILSFVVQFWSLSETRRAEPPFFAFLRKMRNLRS